MYDPTQGVIDALEALHAMAITPDDPSARPDAIEALDALADWLRRDGTAPDVEDAIASVDLPASENQEGEKTE